ncbi:MAG: FAD-dependent oxidoreductase, partial [Dehalococcoidaceae bacterium]|nr:FAD-dependent oxidoreductase [Dehalococcoidaceae bacterium]
MDNREPINSFTRRDFIKTAAAGSMAMATAGAFAGLLGGCSRSNQEPEWQMTADIVVVGSGAAASAAAITARDQGASVIMLEKALATGGTTIKSGGVSWVPNNFALREQGITDYRQDCLRMMARFAYPQLYNCIDNSRFGLPEHEYNLLAAYWDKSSQAFDYLMDIGACQFVQSGLLPDYVDHAEENKVLRGRGLAPTNDSGGVGFGFNLIAQTRAWLDSHGVEILTGHRVVEIVLNSERQVTGVLADTGEGITAVRARKAVIFGSGGFTHDPGLVVHFQPGPLYGGCAVITNEGDFVRLAQAVGARLANMNTAWHAQIPLEPALDSPSTPNDIWQPAGDSMILVNKHGVRVVNEKRSYNDRSKVHFYWDPVEQEFTNQVLMM